MEKKLKVRKDGVLGDVRVSVKGKRKSDLMAKGSEMVAFDCVANRAGRDTMESIWDGASSSRWVFKAARRQCIAGG